MRSDRVVWGLMGLNLAVFAMWHGVALDRPDWMIRHFVVSVESIKSGRVWTLLGSAISHVDATHLLMNMLGLWVFGRPVAGALGEERFLGLYGLGALVASGGFVAWAAFTGSGSSALGASGAVSAIAIVFAALFPRVTLIVILFPMPAWVAAVLFVALDLYGLFNPSADALLFGVDKPIAHSAHLGGAVAGAAVVGVLWWRGRVSFRPRRTPSEAE